MVLQRLTDELDDKEEEIRRLRSKVRELEDALSQSRMATRTNDVERNEVCNNHVTTTCVITHVVFVCGLQPVFYFILLFSKQRLWSGFRRN